jgi:hypothetical protein
VAPNSSPSSTCNEHVVYQLSLKNLQNHDLAPSICDSEIVNWAFGIKVDMMNPLIHDLITCIVLFLFKFKFSGLALFFKAFWLWMRGKWLFK